MNNIGKSLLISFLLFSILYAAQGQYVVRKASEQSTDTSQDGSFYSLPATTLKVNVVYEKIDKIRGPLSDYTHRITWVPQTILLQIQRLIEY